jgi:uncharacterized FlaG/YvyC family protein
MSLDISSFSGRLSSLAQAGQTPYRENTRNGLKDNLVKNLNANKIKSDDTEARVSDPLSLSANHQVSYKVNPKTHEVVIHIVDSESGEIIRQIPGEDFLKLTRRIAEFNRTFLDKIT